MVSWAYWPRCTQGNPQARGSFEIAMVDASVVTNDGMGYVLDGVRQVIANEVHSTAGGPLMIAGDFRFIWKQLTRHFDVTDGSRGR